MHDSLKLYLNGEYLQAESACIPVTDRGFLFADSVYEVIPAYAGQLFRLEQHLQRLDNSLAGIKMDNPLTHAEWETLLNKLAAQLPGQDQQLYLQVTRGAYGTRQHQLPADIKPTVLAMTTAVEARLNEDSGKGISVITVDDIRWDRCNIKTTNLLPNILAKELASNNDAGEAIFIRDGLALEGTASNLFIIRHGLLITPPKSDLLLPGVTRDLILELASDAGISYAEATISLSDLEQADEIWLTSSTREIMPVTQLNGQAVGNGHPGPIWQSMNELFLACKARLRLHAECGTE